MSSLALYFHTIRHLRPRQIVSFAWFRLYKPRVKVCSSPLVRSIRTRFAAPIVQPRTMIAPGVFRFLGVERRCEQGDDWRCGEMTKLWRYNLHYFDDLMGVDAQHRIDLHRDLIHRWIAEIPPGWGDGWEPYPTSRRIVNWLKWGIRGNTLSPAILDSLATQVRWLCRRMEYHILGNHLLANAKALIYAGVFFKGAEADGWYALGMRILKRELGEQILSDGGHFELSPMYHASVLEDLLDLLNVRQAYGFAIPADWLECVGRMRAWLRVMVHPDGEISFFNDAAFGVAPNLDELDEYAQRLGLAGGNPQTSRSTALDASGYLAVVSGPAYLLCDCAALGPDYQPGHAHADTLGFELSLGRQRIFVNSGTSQYGADAERRRQRGTAAHNCVVIDGQDSSEVWGGFRVARRARVRILRFASADGRVILDASHDGYRRLAGKNEHRRCWMLDDQSLVIEDEVSGSFGEAISYLHCHPDVNVTLSGENAVELMMDGMLIAHLTFDGAMSVHVAAGTWHPGFGVVRHNQRISVRFKGSRMATRIEWGMWNQ